ncbi:MAG: hypothetical protein NTY19_42105 [Planctomycetota bacterium]|nr:hypothetical protein [Planctomycetota bacterium]
MDVLNYFREDWVPDPDGAGLVPRRVRRDRIRDRLVGVLESLNLPNDGGELELYVVAHSQGTIIALDVLADPRIRHVLDAFQRRVLITMGSPFTHLYQYYFPAEFPPLTSAGHRWDSLREALANRATEPVWHNIFRIDDFVGTFIKGFNDHCPENRQVDALGHVNYWNDPQVLDLVRPILGL